MKTFRLSCAWLILLSAASSVLATTDVETGVSNAAPLTKITAQVVQQTQAKSAAKAALAARATQMGVQAPANTNSLNAMMATPVVQAASMEAVAASPEIQQDSSGGAVAVNAPHTVRFASDANTSGAVDMLTRDGQEFQSTIVGLAYFDPVSGKSAIIAPLQSSIGELLPPNQLIYPNALAGQGFSADILYTYTATSLEQDIVLHNPLPSPVDYGLSVNSRVLVLTEFSKFPAPRQIPGMVELNSYNQALGVTGESAIPDSTLQFGTMQIVAGRAFVLGQNASILPVAKSWEVLDGRQLLVEAVPYSLLNAEMASLPVAKISNSSHQAVTIATGLKKQEQLWKSKAVRSRQSIQLAKAGTTMRTGMVLDYLMVSSPLLNLDMGDVSGPKVGFAAIGQTASDFWNDYNDSVSRSSLVVMSNLHWADNTASGINVIISNAPGIWDNGSSDPMYDWYVYSAGDDASLTFTNLPPNVYDFYIYGHTGGDEGNGIYQLYENGVPIAFKGTSIWGTTWQWPLTNWIEGKQYIVFRNVAVTNQTITIDVQPAVGDSPIINGLQIVPASSVPAPSLTISNLINFNFSASLGDKVGPAAIGLTSTDYWNYYSLPGARPTTTNFPNLLQSDSTATSVGLRIDNAPGGWGNGVPDGMYGSYIYPWDGGNVTLTLTNLPVGNYDFYLYGHAGDTNDNTHNSLFQLWSGIVEYGLQATTIWGTNWFSTNWEEGQQYAVFHDVSVDSTNQPVQILVSRSQADAALVCGMQIVYKGPADTDGDGLPDAWEMLYFGRLGEGGTNDNDGDGLSNVREYQLSLNPDNAYTYGDASNDLYDSEIVWIEDSTPNGGYENDGSITLDETEDWNWVTYWDDGDGWNGNEVDPHSGNFMDVSDNVTNAVHGHYFDESISVMHVNTNDLLYAYVNLDSKYPPTEVMLQWYVTGDDGTGSWEHRAYWGADSIGLGTNGTAGHYYAGALPAAGTWVRLEVPASAVGLEGKIVQGMAFTLYSGRAAWDSAGRINPDRDGNGLPDAWEMQYFGYVGVNPNAYPFGDGLTILQDYQMGLNPTVDQSMQTGSRVNYTYDLTDWLTNVVGLKTGAVILDNEGNVTGVSQ